MRSSRGRCLPGSRVKERPHGAGSGCLASQQLVGNGRATNIVALPFPLAAVACCVAFVALVAAGGATFT
jgi:hypothetical protein